MAEAESLILEILKQYQKKSGIISEIYRLTQEMDQMLSVNDRGSTQLILEMRQEEMDKAAKCNETIAYLEEHLSETDQNWIRTVIHEKKEMGEDCNWEKQKLKEIARSAEQLLQKTIELDQRLNLRVAGEDSFYNQKK